MFDDALRTAAAGVIEAATRRGALLTTAESCTGGLLAGLLTTVPGSSAAVAGGTVTYSNEAKARLGVDPALIEAHGAVSEPVARAMADAAHAAVPAPLVAAVGITGVAGPGGGTAEKPVGLVHFGARCGDTRLHREMRFGDIGRDEVRRESLLVALELYAEALG